MSNAAFILPLPQESGLVHDHGKLTTSYQGRRQKIFQRRGVTEKIPKISKNTEK